MTERTPTEKTPEELIKIKDDLLALFRQLPPEHRATQVLALLRSVMDTDMTAWIVHSVALLYPSVSDAAEMYVFGVSVSRDDLKHTHFSDEDIARLTDDDLQEIALRMRTHYANDMFWDELVFHTEAVLREKANNP